MNLPNLLSLFRLFVTVFFILFIAYERFGLGLLLFALQALSDLLDGFFARRMGSKTNLGAYLDPLADKVMLSSSYIVLCFHRIVPLPLVSAVLVRDIVIGLGFFFLVRRGLVVSPAPNFISKMTTVFQMLTVVYVLLLTNMTFESSFSYINAGKVALEWATGLLTAASGLQYVFAGCVVFFRKEVV
jgi:cardiolipin synthase